MICPAVSAKMHLAGFLKAVENRLNVVWVLQFFQSVQHLAAALQELQKWSWLDTSSAWVPCRFSLGPGRVWHALVNSFNVFVGMTLEVEDGDGYFFWKRQKVRKLGKEANATEEVGTTCLKWQKFFVNVLALEQLLLPSYRADACQKLQVQSGCCKVPFLVQGCRG